MLNSIKDRNLKALAMARNILRDYAGDFESAQERILEIVNGQRWLERLVVREMKKLTMPLKRKAA